MVSDEPQAADIRVANLTEPGDLVVTQDWGLAALVLSKGAIVLTPKGRVFKNNEIAFLLEERDTMARIRRGGKRTRGPKNGRLLMTRGLRRIYINGCTYWRNKRINCRQVVLGSMDVF